MTTKLLIIICVELLYTLLVFWSIYTINCDKYKYCKIFKVTLFILFLLLRVNSVMEITSKIGIDY